MVPAINTFTPYLLKNSSRLGLSGHWSTWCSASASRLCSGYSAVRSGDLIDQECGKLAKEVAEGFAVRLELGHQCQRVRHMPHPGVPFFYSNGERHVPRPHSRVTPLHAVGHVPAGALDQKQRQMPLGRRQVCRVQRPENRILLDSPIELLDQPVVWLVASYIVVNGQRFLHIR